jgi:L-ribulose-5-phosphate 3-epimerase
MNHPNRREFLKTSAQFSAGISLAGITGSDLFAADKKKKKPLYRISLAQWSMNTLFKGGKLDNLDFSKTAKQDFKINAIEYVNQFFFDKAKDKQYLAEMKTRAEGEGVKSLLIMVDREGKLGDPDKKKRRESVEKHFKWAEAAKFLDCHSLRVNAASAGSYEEQLKLAADGLRQLTEFGADLGLNVIVENHGGLSSNGQWLAAVMKRVDHPRCGTLPDFGNFVLDRKTGEEYDCYKGVKELMPFAKAVSAKSYDFDEQGNDTKTDFLKMMKIVVDAGYDGYVGIEYEGNRLSKHEGIKATKKLLQKVRRKLAASS